MSEELFAVLFCRQYFAQLPQGALQFLEAFYKAISTYFLQPPPIYFYEKNYFFNKSKSQRRNFSNFYKYFGERIFTVNIP